MRCLDDDDLGGDPDDACGLIMMLGWPGVEIVGITTTLDPGGRRAGMVYELLERAGRTDIPVVAGSGASMTTMSVYNPKTDDVKYWGKTIASRPARPGAALDLLSASIDRDATVVAIGPMSNIAMLEIAQPRTLSGVPVVMMGGWVYPPEPGFPEWGPNADWNIQCDAHAAYIVCQTAEVTLATLPIAMKAHLTTRDLPRLRKSGPIGNLLADQTVANAEEASFSELCEEHSSLPDDLLNFHWDPVALAVAVEWDGATIEEMAIRPELDSRLLRFHPDNAGRSMRVLVDLDAQAFGEAWLASIERAQADN
ncbi:MAG: nucleoside hydrolase [Pseudomonadota bacterium]